MCSVRSTFLALSLIVPAVCLSQPPALRLPSFADLQRDAVESVNLSFGPFLLWVARCVISDHDPQGAAVKRVLRGLHKVQVRNYRFKSDHVYRQADLEALRSQLTAPTWHQMAQVRDHGTGEDVDV